MRRQVNEYKGVIKLPIHLCPSRPGLGYAKWGREVPRPVKCRTRTLKTGPPSRHPPRLGDFCEVLSLRPFEHALVKGEECAILTAVPPPSSGRTVCVSDDEQLMAFSLRSVLDSCQALK